jgi:cytochrome b subunit of formate dehydrogenase
MAVEVAMRQSKVIHRELEEAYQRFDVSVRIQHMLVLIGVLGCAATGFGMRFPGSWWGLAMRSLTGNFGDLLVFHLFWAMTLLLGCLIHIIYVIVKWRKGERPWGLVPSRQDLADAKEDIRYVFGLRYKRPSFGRFSYIEKFEYWAIVWGVIIMGITGLSMWFPGVASHFVSLTVLDGFQVIHRGEAALAILTIVIWHWFNVHFSPETFPMNWTWLTGRIPVHRQMEEHEREVQEWNKAGEMPDKVWEPVHASGNLHATLGKLYTVSVIELIAYLVIIGWLVLAFVGYLNSYLLH